MRYRVYKFDASCKGCTERRTGCHSACEKYKAFREAADAEKEKRRKWLETNDYYSERQRAMKDAELMRKKRGRK